MAVRLLDTHHGRTAFAMDMLGLANGQFNCSGLAVAMPDHPAILVKDVPTVAIVIDMKSEVGAGSHSRPFLDGIKERMRTGPVP